MDTSGHSFNLISIIKSVSWSIQCPEYCPVCSEALISDHHQRYMSVTIFCGPAEVVQHDVIVAAAEHPALHQAKLFPSGQLPLTGETSETGQVVHAAPSPSHPVAGVHLPATLGALGAKPTVGKKKRRWRLVAGNRDVPIICRARQNWLPTEHLKNTNISPNYYWTSHIGAATFRWRLREE